MASITISPERGLWLKSELLQRGVFQRHIVNATGIDAGSLSKFLSGERGLPEEKVLRIEDYLKMPGVLMAPDADDPAQVVEEAESIVEQMAAPADPDVALTAEQAAQVQAVVAVQEVEAPVVTEPELEQITETVIIDETVHHPTPAELDEIFDGPDVELVTVRFAEKVAEAIAPAEHDEPRLTASEWLNVRDEIADRVLGAMRGMPDESQHYAIAEALLGLGLINVARALEAAS